MEYKVLSKINSPKDLKSLNAKERETLACEIRNEMLEIISKNGGHLASNFGVVELTIALHTVFDMPFDKILWDVSHQGYVHKLITGRRQFFKSLRLDNGCSGFLSMAESEYDAFGAGHAGTAVSAALGFAVVRDRMNKKNKIIAVVGDGSLNCGTTLEGLNNLNETTKDLIIILNDNKMSISRNVGAMAQYLNRIITGKGYNKFKPVIRRLVEAIPFIGKNISKKISRLEEATKSIFVRGVIFEELGIRYIGPIDGHNTEEIIRILEVVREFDQPVIVHVLTEKGRGYKPAEDAPEKFHGLASFDPDTGLNTGKSNGISFSLRFGKAICDLAEKREDIVAITAGMCQGTGLAEFAKKFPKRFFDVGIAEEHAIVFAAALSASGMRPFVAIYSTFLQRSLDYIYHDICLQNLPVIICADRAGIVDDGPTHHGIYEIAFLRSIPNLSIVCPSDGQDLDKLLNASYNKNAPVIIRYPKAVCIENIIADASSEKLIWGKSRLIKNGKDISIWTMGAEALTAVHVSKILEEKGISTKIVDCRFIKPFDKEALVNDAKFMPLVTIEDCAMIGGLASTVDEIIVSEKHHKIRHFGWNDEIIPHGTIENIRDRKGISAEKIAEAILDMFNSGF